jgi:hypothetical protein
MRRCPELLLWALFASVPLALIPNPAAAYLGPGGGLSLFTTALAMFAAFSVSVGVVVTRQVRAVKAWFQRRRHKGKPDGKGDEHGPTEDESEHGAGRSRPES